MYHDPVHHFFHYETQVPVIKLETPHATANAQSHVLEPNKLVVHVFVNFIYSIKELKIISCLYKTIFKIFSHFFLRFTKVFVIFKKYLHLCCVSQSEVALFEKKHVHCIHFSKNFLLWWIPLLYRAFSHLSAVQLQLASRRASRSAALAPRYRFLTPGSHTSVKEKPLLQKSKTAPPQASLQTLLFLLRNQTKAAPPQFRRHNCEIQSAESGSFSRI
jgi:hypothetical protein